MEEILLKHTQEQYDLLKSTAEEQDLDRLEEISSHYDAIYIHPVSFHVLDRLLSSDVLMPIIFFP